MGLALGLALYSSFVTSAPGADDLGTAPAPYPDALHSEATALRLGEIRGDDDGIEFDPEQMVGNPQSTLTVTVNGAGASSRLYAWIDFNQDGFFGQEGEIIVSARAVSDGDHAIRFAIPPTSPSGSTYARFRLSNSSSLGPGGSTTDGEVEDYVLTLSPPAAAPLKIFSPRKSIYIAPGRASAAVTGVADLDEDGDADLVITSNQVLWMENDGDENFSPHIIQDALSVGFGSADFARVVQLDGVGGPDIVFSDTNLDDIVWFKNDGGSFQRFDASPSNRRSDYGFVDANQDGHMDLLLLRSSDSNTFRLNQGDQNFVEAQASSDQIEASIDLDRDGDIDLFSGEGNLTWHENTGDLAFVRRTIGTEEVSSVHPADIDGDGDIDLVVKEVPSYELRWYENDGAQVFTPHTIGTGTSSSRFAAIITADIDGDGDPDVIAQNVDAGTGLSRLTLFENQADGSFATHVIANANSSDGIFPSDLDGDGDLDIIAGTGWFENLNVSHDFSSSAFTVTESDSQQTTSEVSVTRTGDTSLPSEVVVILSGAVPNEASIPGDVISQSVTLTFAPGEIEKSAEIVIGGDLSTEADESVRLDLDIPGVIQPTAILTILNDDIDSDGDSLSDKLENTVHSTDPAKPDSDNDGVGDAAELAAGTDANISDTFDFGDLLSPFPIAAHLATGPLLGTERGGENDGVSPAGILRPGKANCSVSISVDTAAKLDAWIDFDGDLNFGSARERIASGLSLVAGTQNITFEIPADVRPGMANARFRISTAGVPAPSGATPDGEVEDYQLQISPPAAGAEEFSAASQISLVEFENGKLVPPTTLAHFEFAFAVDLAAADFDQDGHVDLLLLAQGDSGLNSGGGVVVLRNSGLGSFFEHRVLVTEVPIRAHILDFDSDGDLDFLTGGGAHWYENTGGMVFVERSPDGLERSHTSSDIDADGDLDMIPLSGSHWLRNDGGSASFTGRILSGGGAPSAPLFADLDQDGDLDGIGRTAVGFDLLRNDGQLNFPDEAIMAPAPGFGSRVFITDLDGDGRPDILSDDSETDGFQWQRNIDGSNFQTNPITSSESRGRIQHVADIDGDGDIDLLGAPSFLPEPVTWHENDGSGESSPSMSYPQVCGSPEQLLLTLTPTAI